MRNSLYIRPSAIYDHSSQSVKEDILKPYIEKYPEKFTDSRLFTKSGKIKTSIIAKEHSHINTAFQYVNEYFRAVNSGVDPYNEDTMEFMSQGQLNSLLSNTELNVIDTDSPTIKIIDKIHVLKRAMNRSWNDIDANDKNVIIRELDTIVSNYKP